MKYTGTLSVTTHQVGDTVYIIENDAPVADTVSKTKNYVNEDDVEVITYQLTSYGAKWFPSGELFATKDAIKTHFESLTDGL